MKNLEKKIALIGAGNMGSALLGGILKAGVATPEQVRATDRNPAKAEEVSQTYGVEVSLDGNPEVAAWADILIMAVKPGTLPSVLKEIRDSLAAHQILLSVAAAFPIGLIEKLIETRMPVFRAMPNIPVVVQEGATAVASNRVGTPEHRALIEALLRSVGVVCWVEEEMMDAVTAVSGSGPAYVYMVIEALIAGGLKMGLSHQVATRLAEQTVLGAAKQVRDTGLHPAILRDQVITPGGVTIAAIHELERHGLRSMLISAVETATGTSASRTRSLLDRFSHEGPVS